MVTMEVPDRLVPSVKALINGDRSAEEKPRFYGRVAVENEYRDGQIVMVHKGLVSVEVVRN